MTASIVPPQILPSPLILRLEESQLRHGKPDVNVRYGNFPVYNFPAHLAVLRAKSTKLHEHNPGDTITIHDTVIAAEAMLHFMYEGHYDLTHGDETTPLLDMIRLFCKQQNDVYYIAFRYNVDALEELCLTHLREHINTALFESDTIKHASLAVSVLGAIVDAPYCETELSGNGSGTAVPGAEDWPNRAPACEAAMRLWDVSRGMENEDDGETAESIVRKGTAVLCSNYPVFRQEFAICLLLGERVKMRLQKESGKGKK